MSGLRDWVRDCIVNCKTSGKLNPANAAEVLTEKLAEHLDEDGGGMPEGGEPYKQLVTDGSGVAKWEDRLAYSEEGVVVEWDGNTEGLENHTVSLMGQQFLTWHVSDAVIDRANRDGLSVTFADGEEEILTEDDYYAELDTDEYYIIAEEAFMVEKAGVFPSSGVWFIDRTSPNLLKIEEPAAVHKIAPKFLPEGGFGYTEQETEIFGGKIIFIAHPEKPELIAHQTDLELERGAYYRLTVDGKQIGDGAFECYNTNYVGNYFGDSEIRWGTLNPGSVGFLVFEGGIYLSDYAPGPHDIAVYKVEETVHKIDPKYIPEGVGGGGIPTYIIFTEDESNFMLLKSDGNTVLSEEEVLALPWTEGMFVFMDVAFVDATIPSNYRCLQATYNAGGINMSYMRLDFKNDVALSVNLDTGEIGWAQDV